LIGTYEKEVAREKEKFHLPLDVVREKKSNYSGMHGDGYSGSRVKTYSGGVYKGGPKGPTGSRREWSVQHDE